MITHYIWNIIWLCLNSDGKEQASHGCDPRSVNAWPNIRCMLAYVYWTVHHLDSGIKIDQLDVTCLIISLFTAQHVSNVSTSIFRSLRLNVDLFHALYCSGSMCIGVLVLPPQPNHTVTPIHIEPEQYNAWNKSTISCKLLKMDVLTFETCWAVNSEIIKQVTSSWSVFIQVCWLFQSKCT